jgi:hypothetical protein
VAADRELLRSIELDPQFAEAIHRRASFLAVLNRHQEAIAEQKKATEIDAFARPRAPSPSPMCWRAKMTLQSRIFSSASRPSQATTAFSTLFTSPIAARA